MALAATGIISYYWGESVQLQFSPQPGSPAVDITGWTIVLTVKDKYAGTQKLQKTNPTITNGPAGQFTFSLTTTDTQSFPGNTGSNYVFDVWRTDSGSEGVMAIGQWQVLGEVRL